MENNISEKYAVYSVGADGKSVLSVVVDSHEEAKKELEKLKSGTACVKINKSKVENFGKDGEKVVESTEVECWKKENEVAGDKLSSFQKSPEIAVAPPVASASDGLNATGNPLPASEPVKKTFQDNLESFYKYFSGDGDLIGIGYGFFPSDTTATESSASGNVGADGKPEVVVSGEKDEIKKLTEEIAGMKEKLNELVSLEKAEDDNEKDDNKKDDTKEDDDKAND